MEVTWVFNDGSISNPENMPCFGATGRVDWKGCNEELQKELDELAGNLGISRSNGDPSIQRAWTDKRGVKAIRITGETFKNLFHKRNRKIWEYIVHRSIWSPLFEQTAEQICQQEYVDFLVNTSVPSEIQTSLHIWCRDRMNNTSTGDTFDMLSPHIGEHLAFITALSFDRLCLASASPTYGGEGLCQYLDLTFWKNPRIQDLPVIPYNMAQVHGYVMNVTTVWKREGTKNRVLLDTLNTFLNKRSDNHTVKGLFGDFVINGLDKPIVYIKEFFNSKGLL